MVANDYQYILQNMQKELEVQAEKVGNLTKERDNAGKQIGALEAQLSETKVVLDELGTKRIHFNCFILFSRARRGRCNDLQASWTSSGETGQGTRFANY